MIGAMATVFALSTLGLFAALALAPIGGSLAALAAGLVLAIRRGASPSEEAALTDSSDEQVAALREVLQIARAAPSGAAGAGRRAA
jgi:hypothetical protein